MIYCLKISRDTNGNRILQIKFPFSKFKGFSIQTNNGCFPTANKHLVSQDTKDEIFKELKEYVSKYGTEKQKRKLKII